MARGQNQTREAGPKDSVSIALGRCRGNGDGQGRQGGDRTPGFVISSVREWLVGDGQERGTRDKTKATPVLRTNYLGFIGLRNVPSSLTGIEEGTIIEI